MTRDALIEYTNWDWLPRAAAEIESYIARLLAEANIKAHDISARAKSIKSFEDKQALKTYADPMRGITDTVAVRVITYSSTDRQHTADLIRERFAIVPGEDRNPGSGRPDHNRGYDCHHIVISGEEPDLGSGWLVAGGELSRYFSAFGGLEIQVRTVAAHAWAEFEHARRYKGVQYKAVSDQDRQTIDQLFAAASDARRALDETFVAIDRILAHPTGRAEMSTVRGHAEAVKVRVDVEHDRADPLEGASLRRFLEARFPEDGHPSDAGIEFALELLAACGLDSVVALESVLDSVDGDQVRSLMDSDVPVTSVRRLDDELLAVFGENYVELTAMIGSMRARARQLGWRFDRLRGKTRYSSYSFGGAQCPPHLVGKLLPAARAVREAVRIVADLAGIEAVLLPDTISARDDIPRGARAVSVPLGDGSTAYVATNLNRDASEQIIQTILNRNPNLDLFLLKEGASIGTGSPG